MRDRIHLIFVNLWLPPSACPAANPHRKPAVDQESGYADLAPDNLQSRFRQRINYSCMAKSSQLNRLPAATHIPTHTSGAHVGDPGQPFAPLLGNIQPCLA
jgi:hypothetical protein